ncbi:MAG: histidine phosphatase family protein [Gemmatimonadaceae bacterium]|nr:histidine phosphatase family protein [Gemmatimonadaceae bacterium]
MRLRPGLPSGDAPVLTLHFVREGSAFREEGRCLGQADARLSQAGRRECRVLSRQLTGHPARVVSSDLQRACETTMILTTEAFEVEPRLRDMHYGAWDGMTWDDIDSAMGPADDDWSPAWPSIRAPGGESFDDVVRRVRSWLDSLQPDGTDLLVVAHAASIRAAAVVLLDMPPSRAMSLALDHARVSTFSLTSTGASLVRWNAQRF